MEDCHRTELKGQLVVTGRCLKAILWVWQHFHSQGKTKERKRERKKAQEEDSFSVMSQCNFNTSHINRNTVPHRTCMVVQQFHSAIVHRSTGNGQLSVGKAELSISIPRNTPCCCISHLQSTGRSTARCQSIYKVRTATG